MSKVIDAGGVSLDGFIADTADAAEPLFTRNISLKLAADNSSTTPPSSSATG